MDLTEKILFYMKRYHMIPQNKNIVVGLSGGADSVCLLYVLVALRKKLGLEEGENLAGFLQKLDDN